MDSAVVLKAVIKKPGENKLGEKRGAITPAVNQATAKLVKNSENILPIN